MEIYNHLNALNAYNSAMSDKSRVEKNSDISKLKNTDKVEFSSTKTSNLTGLKESIIQKVESFTNPERIAILSKSIKKGQYHNHTETITRTIIE